MFRVTREFELDSNQPIFGCLDDVARGLKIDKTRRSSLLALPLATIRANGIAFTACDCTEYSKREVQDVLFAAIILCPYSCSRGDDKALPYLNRLSMEIRQTSQVDLKGDLRFSPDYYDLIFGLGLNE